MFTNLAIIRRYYIDRWVNLIEKNKKNKDINPEIESKEDSN